MFFLLLPFLLLDEGLEFTEKLDAEEGDKDGNENVGNDRRKDIIEEGANSRPENSIGDDYHDYVVVYQAGLLYRMSSEHQGKKVVEGCTRYQRIADDCGG